MSGARRPFHETVVDRIRNARSVSEFHCLAQLIVDTEIPKNHDVIIEAWRQAFPDIALAPRVIPSLLEQKLEAEEREILAVHDMLR